MGYGRTATDAVRKDSRRRRGSRQHEEGGWLAAVRTYITRLNEIMVSILNEFTRTKGSLF